MRRASVARISAASGAAEIGATVGEDPEHLVLVHADAGGEVGHDRLVVIGERHRLAVGALEVRVEDARLDRLAEEIGGLGGMVHEALPRQVGVGGEGGEIERLLGGVGAVVGDALVEIVAAIEQRRLPLHLGLRALGLILQGFLLHQPRVKRAGREAGGDHHHQRQGEEQMRRPPLRPEIARTRQAAMTTSATTSAAETLAGRRGSISRSSLKAMTFHALSTATKTGSAMNMRCRPSVGRNGARRVRESLGREF